MTIQIETPVDRRTAVIWSRSVVSAAETVFLDTETTGLGRDAEILDITVLAVNGEILFDSLVRPRKPIPVEATLVHGIRDEDVVSAPEWQEVLHRLLPMLSGRLIVVYNADFDRTIVRQCCHRSGMRAPQATWVCAMKTYAAFRGQRVRAGRGFRWHNLQTAAASFGLPAGGHRANSDAEVCRRIVVAMSESRI